MVLTTSYFLKLGHDIVGCKPRAHLLRGARDKFMSLYGTEPQVVALLWSLLPDSVKNRNGCHPKHLLWALNFLKAYDTAINNGILFRCDEKTFRNWSWFMIESIEPLTHQVVSSSTFFQCCFNNILTIFQTALIRSSGVTDLKVKMTEIVKGLLVLSMVPTFLSKKLSRMALIRNGIQTNSMGLQ